MAPAALLTNLFATAVLTTSLSYYYGHWKRQSKITTLVVAISWWLPAIILILLPVDIASAYFTNCTLQQKGDSRIACQSPLFYADPSVFLILWHLVYWSSQFLTWIVIPVMRSYATAGDFTSISKLRSALLDNVIYYGSFLGIFTVALIYLLVTRAVSFDLQYLKVLLITTSNTWGLILVVIFLGYGLVEVPRSLWMTGDPVYSLHKAYVLVSQRNMELLDEEDKLNQIVSQIDQIKNQMVITDPLQPYVLTVFRQAHGSEVARSSDMVHSRVASSILPDSSIDLTALSLRQLVQIHRTLKSTQHRHNRAHALYEEAVREALWLEDVQTFRIKRRRVTVLQEHRNLLTNWFSRCSEIWSLANQYWHAYFRLWLIRALSIVLSGLSLIMVWSECTFFVRSPTLSLTALLLKIEAKQQDYFLLEVSSFLALWYLSFAVFYTVFRLRLFNYYRLVGSHHTDENSLLFCGALLCRLTPSLCLNFLGLVHLDSHLAQTTLLVPQTVPENTDAPTNYVSASAVGLVGEAFTSTTNFAIETAYTHFMGHLDIIPFIAKGFNIYFPMLVLLLCLFTYFRLGSRMLHHLGFSELLYTSNLAFDRSTGSLIDDAIQDGRLLLRKERMTLSHNSMHSSVGESTIEHTKVWKHSSGRSSDHTRLLGFMDEDGTMDQYSLSTRTGSTVEHSQSSSNSLSFTLPVEYSETNIQKQFSLQLNRDPSRLSYW